jgi:hypothetical protein
MFGRKNISLLWSCDYVLLFITTYISPLTRLSIIVNSSIGAAY